MKHVDQIVGFGLIGVSVMHLALGANDPLNSFWTAVSGSLEILFLGLGIVLAFFGSEFRKVLA